MEENEIIKLSQTNKWIGSCPECGHSIWTSDCIRKTEHFRNDVFRCIECKQEIHGDEIIPF